MNANIANSTAPATMPLDSAMDFANELLVRVHRLLRIQVEDWHDGCRRLTDWEDNHLLDNPCPEALARHAKLLGDLEFVGRWVRVATRAPNFRDKETAELVEMTLRDLQDRRALWHGIMTSTEREKVLQQVFHES